MRDMEIIQKLNLSQNKQLVRFQEFTIKKNKLTIKLHFIYVYAIDYRAFIVPI